MKSSASVIMLLLIFSVLLPVLPQAHANDPTLNSKCSTTGAGNLSCNLPTISSGDMIIVAFEAQITDTTGNCGDPTFGANGDSASFTVAVKNCVHVSGPNNNLWVAIMYALNVNSGSSVSIQATACASCYAGNTNEVLQVYSFSNIGASPPISVSSDNTAGGCGSCTSGTDSVTSITQNAATVVAAYAVGNTGGTTQTAPSGFTQYGCGYGTSNPNFWYGCSDYLLGATGSTTASLTPGQNGPASQMWWQEALITFGTSTVVTATVIGSCTFFELQCWWYPLLFMALYSGMLLMVAHWVKASPKGKAHIFMSALTYGSLIAVILGIMNIVFPLLMLILNTIIVLRLRGS